ncbi:hypothetical protein ACFOU2_22645 [Bacillus songklensis]|uniref:Uncharacterized protein n=1 Tax=Bacillus songklensis TaxID=1069116 RepID=A0ABV8B9X1_9BACI
MDSQKMKIATEVLANLSKEEVDVLRRIASRVNNGETEELMRAGDAPTHGYVIF